MSGKRDHDNGQEVFPKEPSAVHDDAPGRESKRPKRLTFAERQMALMGHTPGTGLGKFSQGRADPVEASMQFGRRGFGFEVKGLERTQVIDQEIEDAPTSQIIEWMPTCNLDVPRLAEMKEWIDEGPYKLSLDDEDSFCETTILTDLLQAKSLLDTVDPKTFTPARNRANPYESIKKEFFINRAAMKMANMDSLADFMFTKHEAVASEDQVQEALTHQAFPSLLYFADICAGPGGFSEYVFWRKQHQAKGFGFTLKDNRDFKLAAFNRKAPNETFHCYYGVDGTGNIYNTESMREFQALVRRQTNEEMVHFVMADGGLDVTGNENVQEILNKQLLLCQFASALSLLQKGGHFVCKTFDLFTPFSLGLLYLLYRNFESIAIVKPFTSRPANSERYVYCKNLRQKNPEVVEYLWDINDRLNKMKPQNSWEKQTKDVNEIVSRGVMEQSFVEYVVRSNNEIGKQQIRALKKLHNFLKDLSLPGEDQAAIRATCLAEWSVPDQGPFRPLPRLPPDAYFRSNFPRLVEGRVLDVPLKQIKLHYVRQHGDQLPLLNTIDDWAVVIKSSHNGYTLVVCTHHKQVFKWNVQTKGWEEVEGLVLPRGTCFVAEEVMESVGPRQRLAMHIIDIFRLGLEEEVWQLPYVTRMKRGARFLHALQRDAKCAPVLTHYKGRMIEMRIKPVYSLREIHLSLGQLKAGRIQGSSSAVYPAVGLLLVPVTMRGNVISFRSCLKERRSWYPQNPDGLTADQLQQFVSERC